MSTVCRQLSVVCAFSEVMASTGRAGPDRAGPGRAGPGFIFTGPGRYFNDLNGPGRIGPKFYRAGPAIFGPCRALSHTVLVFPHQTSFRYSDGDPPPLTGASNGGGVGTNRDSEPIYGFTACCRRCHWLGVINTVLPDCDKL